MNTERVIRVHFIGGNTLQLRGDHVKSFMQNYRMAVGNGETHFESHAKDSIIFQIRHVTFIEDTTIEVEYAPF